MLAQGFSGLSLHLAITLRPVLVECFVVETTIDKSVPCSGCK